MTKPEIIAAVKAYCSTLPADAGVTTSAMVSHAIPEAFFHDKAYAVVQGAACTILAQYCSRGPSYVNKWNKLARPWLWHGESEPHDEAEAVRHGSLRDEQLGRLEAKLDQVLALLHP